MKFTLSISIVIFQVLVPILVIAQSNSANHKLAVEIQEVALIGLIVNEGEPIQLNTLSPTEAGNAVNFSPAVQTNKVWINYSSIVKNINHKRKVVAMVEGEIPEGVTIAVEASEAEGTGKGKLGHPAGLVFLSGEPKEVISDIGSCFTGKGARNGHSLSYLLTFDNTLKNMEKISKTSSGIHVIYTLTDYN